MQLTLLNPQHQPKTKKRTTPPDTAWRGDNTMNPKTDKINGQGNHQSGNTSPPPSIDDTFPVKTIDERVSNLETTSKHIITVIRNKQSIGIYECCQEGKIGQISSDLEKGERMIQKKFTEIKEQIQTLDNSIQERKTANGNQDKSLSKGEEAFDSIFKILGTFNTRISTIEGRIGTITWFMGGTTGAIIFYVAYIVLKDFMNF